MKYIPGLNGLRAFAVINVIIFHWGLPSFDGSKTLERFIPNGNFGVNVFFVLSGFLITSILLAEKSKLELPGHSEKRILYNFYSRRFLRIFPIYYITIFGLTLSDLPDYQKNLPYYLTYTENFNVVFRSYWDSFCHTWSLSVEEQFYLIWPFVIIFTPRSRLVPVILFFIALGPLFSIFQTYVLRPPLNAFILTPSCFDSFGMGALLAFNYSKNDLRRFSKWTKWLLPLSLVLFFYWMFAPAGGHLQYFKRFFQSILACGMIQLCLSPKYVKLRNFALGNQVFNWLGIVSYGLYLYHYALPWFYNKAKELLRISFLQAHPLIDYLVLFLLLLLITSLSYYLIERPILRQKRRFI